MRLQIASDIHTEFHHSDQGRKLLQRIAKNTSNEVDAIIVPGDLSTTKGLKYALSMLCNSYENVIYTTGNHEYYQSSKAKTEDLIQECIVKYSNLHWLNRSHVEIKGQRFIGCTLWFPANPWVLANFHYTNDVKLIQSDRTSTDVYRHWILEEFEINKKYLSDEVRPGDVVLTHYIPCTEGIAVKWKNYRNDFFMGDVSDVIKNNQPKLWVYGHTHSGKEFILHNTKLVCNPCAYPHEIEYGQFNDSLIIDI